MNHGPMVDCKFDVVFDETLYVIYMKIYVI
jgi:hypothetical protein